MTGQCYHCTDEHHEDCHSITCTCCGESNLRHQQAVDALEAGIRASLLAASCDYFDPHFERRENGGLL